MTEEGSSENRSAHRRRMLKAGFIAFNRGYTTLPCVVRDMSETGARLQLDNPTLAPDHFTLHVELDGLKVDCKVVWTRASLFGVAFVGPIERTGRSRTQVVSPGLTGGQTGETPEERDRSKPQDSPVSHYQSRRPTFGKRR